MPLVQDAEQAQQEDVNQAVVAAAAPPTVESLPAVESNTEGSAAAPASASEQAPIESASAPSAAGSNSFIPQTAEQNIQDQQQGLVSMLDSGGDYLALARKRGERTADARGLGNSSLSARAAEGAAIEAVQPFVLGATDAASRERMHEGSLVQDAEQAALDRDVTREINTQNITSNETMQGRQLSHEDSQLLTELQHNRDMQGDEFSHEDRMQLRGLEAQERLLQIQLDSDEMQQLLNFQHELEVQGNQLSHEDQQLFDELTSRWALQQAALSQDEMLRLTELAARVQMHDDTLTSEEERTYRELDDRLYMQERALTAEEEAQLLDIDTRIQLNDDTLTAQERMHGDELASQAELQEARLSGDAERQADAIEADRALTELRIFGDIALQNNANENQASLNDSLYEHQTSMQMTDIEYKTWLENSGYWREGVLQTNAHAVQLFDDYLKQSTAILGDSTLTPLQQESGINILNDNMNAAFELFGDLDGITLGEMRFQNLETVAPPSPTTEGQTSTNTGPADTSATNIASQPAASTGNGTRQVPASGWLDASNTNWGYWLPTTNQDEEGNVVESSRWIQQPMPTVSTA